MGSSQSEKVASHERIVDFAATTMRRDGIDGVSVADVMKGAGLTHGGFYRHFASRDDLITEAVTRALREGSQRAQGATDLGGLRAMRALIDGYLSPTHRDHPETGCAVAGLGEDVARTSTPTREAYQNQVLRYIDLLIALDPEEGSIAARRAFLILSALVGALVMSRAVKDDDVSREILAETAASLKELLVEPPAP